MSVNDLGRSSGFYAFGEVVNVSDDPSQSGKVRVKWLTGAMSTPKLNENELPWTGSLFPPTNPNKNQVGGPVTGLMKGSKVYGINIGDGEMLILGSVPASGNSQPDQNASYDSDVPQPTKVSQNGGESQPRHGDVNPHIEEGNKDSIVTYGERKGGAEKRPAQFADLPEPIGTLAQNILGGKMKLLEHLISIKNKSGAIIPAPQGLANLKEGFEGVPFPYGVPGMSQVISGNPLGAVLGLLKQFGADQIANNISQVAGGNVLSLLSGLSSFSGSDGRMGQKPLEQPDEVVVPEEIEKPANSAPELLFTDTHWTTTENNIFFQRDYDGNFDHVAVKAEDNNPQRVWTYHAYNTGKRSIELSVAENENEDSEIGLMYGDDVIRAFYPIYYNFGTPLNRIIGFYIDFDTQKIRTITTSTSAGYNEELNPADLVNIPLGDEETFSDYGLPLDRNIRWRIYSKLRTPGEALRLHKRLVFPIQNGYVPWGK